MATDGQPRSEDETWWDRARCFGLNPDWFFPEDSVGVEFAQTICATCPVWKECLEYALQHNIDHGIWGGASERERRRIRRQRRLREA